MANATSTDSKYPHNLNPRYTATGFVGHSRQIAIFARSCKTHLPLHSTRPAWSYYARVEAQHGADFISRMRIEDADIRIALDQQPDRLAMMWGPLLTVEEFTSWLGGAV